EHTCSIRGSGALSSSVPPVGVGRGVNPHRVRRTKSEPTFYPPPRNVRVRHPQTRRNQGPKSPLSEGVYPSLLDAAILASKVESFDRLLQSMASAVAVCELAISQCAFEFCFRHHRGAVGIEFVQCEVKRDQQCPDWR